MPGNYKILLSAFGLNKLRTVVYKKQIGEESPTGASDFKSGFEVDTPGNLNSGSRDGSVKNWMGLSVFSDLRFRLNDREEVLLETVLMTVVQQKNIVRTVVPGQPGTRKEYIADGDYEVSIKGALVSPRTNDFPEYLVTELHDVLNRPDSIDIVCDYLRLFGIYRLSVLRYSFPQQVGFQNMQLFEINALSDTPENLIEDA